MMKRIICLLLALCFLLAGVSAFADNNSLKAANELFEITLAGRSIQEWLDDFVAPGAGSNADNYVLFLNRSAHSYRLDSYAQAALACLQPGEISNPVSRQRCALTLLTCDSDAPLPEGLADETIGKLGVMSYVFGLHLLNNGAQSQLWTSQTLVDKLLSMQKEDGGWAVMGNYGDIDVTAMCIQALACCEMSDELSAAIERAVLFLSEKQLESGGYTCTGAENCESSAQVVIALSSLGIDAANDERFIRNGTSVMDAMLAYRLESGLFSHLPGDETANETATLQVLLALFAHSQTGMPFYDFRGITRETAVEQSFAKTLGWKLYAFAAIIVFALAGTVFSLLRKHGRVKTLIAVLMVSALSFAAVCFLNFESAEDYYGTSSVRGEKAGSVFLEIRCDNVAGKADDSIAPAGGEILRAEEFTLYEGDSVFDILTDAARRHELHMEYEGGTEAMAYICAINNLYEYAHGELSGWMYLVNGETPSVGCGSCLLNDGDVISWQYTTNLGEDLK